MLKKCFLGLMAISTLAVSSAVLADISIGVIAPRGKDSAAKRWSEYASYLSGEIGQKVKMVPFLPSEVLKGAKDTDFALVNPTQTIILVETQQAKVLATLNKKSGSQFGGVIVAKKGSGIKHSADLKGKKVMGLKFRAAAGAYMFQTKHLIEKGINPHVDFSSFTEGKTQPQLVKLVEDGTIDAAFIRTGMLEKMHKKNKINIDDFVVVDQVRTSSGRPMRTTILYPEWSLLGMSGTNSDLVSKVKNSSIGMSADSKATKKAKIKGFVSPVDNTPMKEVMMELGVYPFDD